MTFGIAFILLMLALGGFAAYQGDRVGMAVGKKRLSILGLRPKYTSRVITVLTGIIIVMITMAGVLLISHTARQSLFGLEDLQQQISSLSSSWQTCRNSSAASAKRTRLQEMNLPWQPNGNLRPSTPPKRAEKHPSSSHRGARAGLSGQAGQTIGVRLGATAARLYCGQLISSYVIDAR